jgi:tetratricopeptide (TPR) repeat protein
VALSTRTLLPEQLARVLETAAAAFPETALLDAGPGLVVLALAPRGLLPTTDELAQARALIESSPVASAGLRASFGSADPRALLFERLWLGDARLREFALRLGTGAPLTDADLSLELGAFHPALMAHALGDALAERNELLIASAVDPAELRARFLDWRLDATQLDALRTHKTRFFRAGLIEQGLELVQLGLTYEPDDPELVADLLLFGQLDPGDFEARRRRLLMRSPRESYRLGASLGQLGRGAEALAVLTALAEKHPDSPAALLSLAEAQERAGQAEAAAEARARAAELDAGADPIFAR